MLCLVLKKSLVPSEHFLAINPANLSCFVFCFSEKPHIRMQRMWHSEGRKMYFHDFFFFFFHPIMLCFCLKDPVRLVVSGVYIGELIYFTLGLFFCVFEQILRNHSLLSSPYM